MSSPSQTTLLEQDAISAHIRSLLQETPVQIASSDSHVVRPWFAGRVDFALDAKDLSAHGFPLVGGRLDYVAGKRVGAIVYKRRLHTINVFMWPGAVAENATLRRATRSGYNLIVWSRNGITYCAVSDLNSGELSELRSLL